MSNIDFDFKILLHTHCLKLVRAKLNSIQILIDAQKTDLNTTTKSSAGDKHETSRAMIHLEQEKLGLQFQEVEKQFRILSQIKIELNYAPQTGSLIQTDMALFYISIGIGSVIINGVLIYIISPLSPLAQAFLIAPDLKSIQFNGVDYSIRAIV